MNTSGYASSHDELVPDHVSVAGLSEPLVKVMYSTESQTDLIQAKTATSQTDEVAKQAFATQTDPEMASDRSVQVKPDMVSKTQQTYKKKYRFNLGFVKF